MTNTKELVLEIKRIIEEEQLEPADLKRMMEEAGEIPLSDATFSRLKEKDSETNRKFNYDYTLAPLARVLGIDAIDANDTEEVKALKEMLRLKHVHIGKLEQELDREKVKRHEQVEEVRAQSKKSLDFLREQMDLKDKRIDTLLERVGKCLNMIEIKDQRIESLTGELLAMKDLKDAYQQCPYRNGGEENGTN